MKLSVVIPAYNEEENIKDAVLDVVKRFPDAQIIVVNDASTDNTLSQLNGTDADRVKVLLNEQNRGHGYSVVRGLRAAQGDYVLYIDADRQIDLDYFVEGYDVVSGWRIHRSDKPFRKFISFCLKLTNLLRHGYYIKDANCPYKIYKREALQALLPKLPETYIVPIACLEVLARQYGLKTVTIPTPHHPYQGVRKGFLQVLNLNALKFFARAFFEIVKL